MKLLSFSSAVILFFGSTPVFAAECENVLAFSKLRNENVRSRDNFDQQAQDYCRGYSEAKKRGGGGGDIGYAGFTIGGSYGSSSSQFSAEQICQSSNALLVRTDAYQTYAESIAPGAFQAYERCLNAKLNLKFGAATVLPKEAIIMVSYVPQSGGETAKLKSLGQGEAKCSWYSNTTDQSSIGDTLIMDKPGTAMLKCTREDSSLQSYVHIWDENAGTFGETSISLPWAPFKDGVLRSSYERLEERLALMEAALKSSVLAVRTTNCPRGFASWDAAKGRFLRGVDSTGTVDADGIRAVGSQQGSDVGSHVHGIVGPANRTGNPSQAEDDTWKGYEAKDRRNYWRGNRALAANETTSVNSGKETRPVNVAVNFCVMD